MDGRDTGRRVPQLKGTGAGGGACFCVGGVCGYDFGSVITALQSPTEVLIKITPRFKSDTVLPLGPAHLVSEHVGVPVDEVSVALGANAVL